MSIHNSCVDWCMRTGQNLRIQFSRVWPVLGKKTYKLFNSLFIHTVSIDNILVLNVMWWSFSIQPIKFTVTALIPCRRGSNQSTTQFRFWTDFLHGNEVACLCDQRSESGALSNCKHGLFHIRYFENGPLEQGRLKNKLS